MSYRRPGKPRSRSASAIAIVLAWLATMPGQAHPEEPDASSLQQQVEELKRQVHGLEEQIKSMQKEPAPPAASSTQPAPKEPAPAAAPQAQPAAAAAPAAAPASSKPSADSILVLRENWRQVGKGMTQAQITSVLGPPTKELRINQKLVWYYYYAGIGGASVFFNSNGHVSSHQPPTIGWW